jgi:DNA (cytosine-5)-methyltransferase 1
MARTESVGTAVGLFAGIGGIELGLKSAGIETELLCEIEPGACAVLEKRFDGVPIHRDIRTLRSLPKVDLVAGGFPCQDLSQAGKTAGIRGSNSGLVGEVFRLLSRKEGPRWLLLENVPFMLRLGGGHAMRFLTRSLGDLGFRWAYRTVDTMAFGLPQRRQRVILLASRTEDPTEVLFHGDAEPSLVEASHARTYGFYWTEGIRGLGSAQDAVPTLKGGSTIGIPSPPAIWFRRRKGFIGLPELRDAERLQGFPADWTLPAERVVGRRGFRWKMVGNSVSVPVAKWVAQQLLNPRAFDSSKLVTEQEGGAWPIACCGYKGKAFSVGVGTWPVKRAFVPLDRFLRYPVTPLSLRATQGFRKRAEASSLRFPDGFLEAVKLHEERMRKAEEGQRKAFASRS